MGCEMRDQNDEKITWHQIARDLRTWLGVGFGASAILGSFIAFGGPILNAPERVEKTDSVAERALDVATNTRQDFQQFAENIRIAFCTKEGWLSAEGRAQMECWRVLGNND